MWHSGRYFFTNMMRYTTGRLIPEIGACCPTKSALAKIHSFFQYVPGTNRRPYDVWTKEDAKNQVCATFALWCKYGGEDLKDDKWSNRMGIDLIQEAINERNKDARTFANPRSDQWDDKKLRGSASPTYTHDQNLGQCR